MMRAPLRVLAVDDEPLAIERLAMILRDNADVRIVATAQLGGTALALAAELQPDLCLLDIGIPDMSGIEIAKSLSLLPRPPLVVFVTAYDSFALAAFGIEAVDYLVKPVAPDELARAIERARRRLAGGMQPPAPSFLNGFWVTQRGGLQWIAVERVDRITAERDYMRLHVGAHSWLINDSLARLERELDPAVFLRVHRGAIVNRHCVVGLRHDDHGWVARLTDGSEQKVSRGYADAVRALRTR